MRNSVSANPLTFIDVRSELRVSAGVKHFMGFGSFVSSITCKTQACVSLQFILPKRNYQSQLDHNEAPRNNARCIIRPYADSNIVRVVSWLVLLNRYAHFQCGVIGEGKVDRLTQVLINSPCPRSDRIYTYSKAATGALSFLYLGLRTALHYLGRERAD